MNRTQEKRVSGHCPRVVVSGLRGGSGKTVVTLGLIGAFRNRGWTVAPFKKGPDYIDPQWISLAAGRPCRNLDAFLMERDQILSSLVTHSRMTEISVVEGNRGLYDGMDDAGTYSTAELAVLLDSPVLLCVDCTKTTRTVAALVLGCKMMNPHLNLGGVILNQVASGRQEEVIRSAVEHETGVPVLGAIPRMKNFSFEERHLGLFPPPEYAGASTVLERLTHEIETCVDVGAVRTLACSASPLSASLTSVPDRIPEPGTVRIGIVRDEAFHFYYPENLESLEQCGAELVEISALQDTVLPDVDALYIGGGFPETHAVRLAANGSFRQSVCMAIENGLPVLAECGGLVYLSQSIWMDDTEFPLLGVFPVSYTVSRRPQGHGYTVVQVDQENVFFPCGTELRGHEFRYSSVRDCRHPSDQTVFCVKRGFGFDGMRDGLRYKNVVASFCHHHATGTKCWASGIVRAALRYRDEKQAGMKISSGTYG